MGKSKLVTVPTGEVARTIARSFCEQLDQEHGKRAVASTCRDMLFNALPDGYTGPTPSEKFLGWLKALGVVYRVPNCSWYGVRKDWRERLEAADFDTPPGKFGSLRPEFMPTPSTAKEGE